MQSIISCFAICVFLRLWTLDGKDAFSVPGELVLPRETKESRPGRIIYEKEGRRLQASDDSDDTPPSPTGTLADTTDASSGSGAGDGNTNIVDDTRQYDEQGNILIQGAGPSFDLSQFTSTVVPELQFPICLYVDPQDEVNTLMMEEMREKIGPEKFKAECLEEKKNGLPVLEKYLKDNV